MPSMCLLTGIGNKLLSAPTVTCAATAKVLRLPVFCAVTKSGGSLRIGLMAVRRPRCRFTVMGGERSTEIAYSVHSATQATCWGARERSRMRVDTFR